MLSSHAALGGRLPVICLALLGLAATSSSLQAGGVDCSEPGQNSPAFPVPEFRDGARLWPDGFRPALPGEQLPLERDSTDYTSLTLPSFSSGHELFMGVDIVGDRLFVLYNVGLQVWDISAPFAERPKRLAILDYIRGDWLVNLPPGENDTHLSYISAIQDPADTDQTLIAVSGIFPIGVSLFSYRRSTDQLNQLYQNTAVDSHQVQLRVVDGRVDGFFASQQGAFVLDLTAASEMPKPCLIDGISNLCPDVFLGRIGDPLSPEPRGRYIDVLQVGDTWYLLSSWGSPHPVVSPPEIWRFDPLDLENTERVYRGTERNSHAVIFLRRNDQTFLALREIFELKIYPIDGCLDADGCATLPLPIYQENLGAVNWPTSTLTYSESHGTPYLYYGVVGSHNLSTPTVERLLDLTHLGGTNHLTEITASGETYTDPCSGSSIGYWSDYYAKNAYGYRNFSPQQGKFNGASHFYRATMATIDVHVRTLDVLFADGFELGTTGAWIASPP
jgi:hypothetical protein